MGPWKRNDAGVNTGSWISSSSSAPPPDHSQNILESITVSTSDVNCLISSLPADKASGPDGISVRLLKECADEISPSLSALFNMSLSQGKVPQEWKEANVVPVFKKSMMSLTIDPSPCFPLYPSFSSESSISTCPSLLNLR
ncbi:Hypothetical predicted protein [Paramuricea clavata]|uniref:Uncharacterized protein n=1 Tax=Paramuricea clavata TaxID=317549 RepID=A0A6S7JAT6_PARCT|nr:Hypothetical predicted protein [Paramuricea clavata]